MMLVEICEPLFQYICFLNRAAKVGESLEVNLVRSEIVARLDRIRAAAAGNADLSVNFEKIEQPLVFFVDSMIITGRSSVAAVWLPIAEERWGIATGDRDFWVHVEDTLRDRSDAATQRLLVFYTCIGLGFTGDKVGQAQTIALKQKEIYARVRSLVDAEQTVKLCPEAYEVNTIKLPLNLRDRIIGIVIALAAMIVLLLLINMYLYERASADLNESLTRILETKAPS